MCVGFSAIAQDDEMGGGVDPAYVNKRGINLLPERGDFALGIEANPFLNYLGGFFNLRGVAPTPSFNGFSGKIYGKYFLEDDRAIRAKLYISTGSTAKKGVVTNDEETINNPLNALATVIDVMKTNHTKVDLNVGYEFRRGHGRVQGFYGGEVGVGFESKNEKFDYANPMTAANQSPSTWDFEDLDMKKMAVRPTEQKYGKSVYAGLGGFVGVEYFFTPQISIGGELNLGLYYSLQMQNETTSEFWNGSTDKLDTRSQRSGGWDANDTGLYTNVGGSIFLMFHF